jgi:uncharacterized protein (TIGR02117 family)
MRIARRVLLAVLVLAFVVAAGTLLPRPLLAGEPEPPSRPILVPTNPIHTDIAVPIDNAIRGRFAFLEDGGMPLSYPEARWLVFGWGGRAFYLETPTWGDLKPLPVLKALTADRSVIHVDLAGSIDETQPAVTRLEIGEGAYNQLVAYIAASFARENQLPIVIEGASYGRYDRFYEANGWFNALVGCNTWTARGLREAGLQTGWWNPLPVSLAISLRLHNSMQAETAFR